MSKNHISLACITLIAAILLILGITGSQVTPAAARELPPTPPFPIASPPTNSLEADSPAAFGWIDGTIKYSTIINCISIINGSPYAEYGSGVYVGYYADPSIQEPFVGKPYYVHVVVYGIGNACSGQNAYIDIGLPANTTLAIDSTNKVLCYGGGTQFTTGCPQSLPASSFNTGYYAVRSTDPTWTWPVPQGYYWEFMIPVISSSTLSGSNFQADIHMLDGNDSPWLYPTRGVTVYTSPLPTAFNKTSPANSSSGVLLNPTLSWSASSGVTSYYSCYDTSNNNACSGWFLSGTTTSRTLNNLTPNTTYYWQVYAHNDFGNTYSNNSTYWSFTTGSLPGAFDKTSPADGAGNQPLSLALQWSASTNATSYWYCYDTSNDSSCSNWVNNGTSTSKTLSGLSPNTTYYWSVLAKNAIGQTFSNYSFWSFTTGVKPGAFIKTLPANGAINQLLTRTIKWTVSARATSYWYCYDTSNDNACSNWVNNGTATSKILSGLSPNTTYYWHVRARNAIGVRYANNSSTAYFSFKTAAPPGVFRKLSPGNGATNLPFSLTLRWTASLGATSYWYCYDTSNNNTCSNWVNNGTATSKTLSGLSPNTSYYWQVKARNAIGVRFANKLSTAFWTFKTKR